MNHYRCMVVSITLHCVFFLFFVVFYKEISPIKKYGNTHSPIVSAFVYHDRIQKKSADKNTFKNEMNKQKNMAETKKLSIKKNQKNYEKKEDSTIKQTGINQGESFAELLVLLHDAIQQKQEYPESALTLQRQGRVTVAFKLYEDGHITDLKLLKSSGTTSLDEAALKAVRDASPFHHLIKYIKNTQEYQIDIVFELA